MKPLRLVDSFCEHKWEVYMTRKQEPKTELSGDMDRTPANNNLPVKVRYYKCTECGSTAKSVETEVPFARA